MKSDRFVFPALFLALACLWTPLCAAEPFIEKTQLIEQGTDGFKSLRIPALAITPKGTVLAFIVGRRAVSDWADNDILLFRSPDGGKTWLPKQTVKEGKGSTVDNPVPIVDRDSGRVTLLFQRNYEKVFQIHSDDEGATWSEPEDITAAFAEFKKQYNWNVVAPGPGHAIQLQNGRFVVPLWLSNGGRSHHPSVIATVYSDDRGKTWHAGEIVPDSISNMNENIAVERMDGSVSLFVRNEEPAYRYAETHSPDGAKGWSLPVFVDDLYTVICFGAGARVSGLNDGEKSRLVFSTPDSRPSRRQLRWWGGRPRENLTMRLSYDDGKTWPVAKLISEGRAGYSDVYTAPDGSIFCLYEHGDSTDGNELNTRYVTVARFNLEWLTDGKDRLEKSNPAPLKKP